MICWSCEKDAGGGVFCAACRAVQPPDRGADHFAVLGAERRFDLDVVALEARYKDLSRKLHPDRYARADPRARRASLQRSVQLNDAWRTLRDPVRRAEYLVELGGIEVGAEEGTTRKAADGTKTRIPVPQDLLMEILELRSELGEARASGDHAKVEAMARDVRARSARAMDAVAASLAKTPPALEAAARELVALRYLRRFLDEVDVHEERRADAAGSADAG